MGDETPFFDLQPGTFPLTIELIRESDGEVVQRIEVPGPGMIQVQGNETPTACRITLATGLVTHIAADGTEESWFATPIPSTDNDVQ